MPTIVTQTEFDEFELRIIQSEVSDSSAKSDKGPGLKESDGGPLQKRMANGFESVLDGRDLVASGSNRPLDSACRLNQSYAVRAESSLGGRASGAFAFPFAPEEVESLVASRPRLGRDLVEDYGKRLFRAAFADEVGTLFYDAFKSATTKNRGLRIKLNLEPAELADLPWEILRPHKWSVVPAQSSRTPLVRQVDLLDSERGLDINGPLRVLLVAASPGDQGQLDLAREIGQVREVLAKLEKDGWVEITVLEKAGKEPLLEILEKGQHHVVHFMMHATFDFHNKQGVLALQGESGTTQLLKAEDLTRALFNNPQNETRLVIFNACQSAKDDLTRPGRGLAAALVNLNLPAVVAMQYPITDSSAIVFSRELYLRLIQGIGIDEAIAKARGEIASGKDGESGNEWSTPVLYLRTKDPHLFTLLSKKTLHRIDYTDDAKAAQETGRAVEQVAKPADQNNLSASIRRAGSEASQYLVDLISSEGSVSGAFELPGWYTAPLVFEALKGQTEGRDPRGDEESLKRIGEDLFDRLFAGEVLSHYRSAVARAQAHGKGVRFSLVADDPQQDLVPWEFLRDPRSKLFLAAGGASNPFFRRIPAPVEVAYHPVERPLKVLFVDCNPVDLNRLDLETEWNWLQEAARDVPPDRVRLDRLTNPTRDVLYDTLSCGGYHIFHFAGYDSFAYTGGKSDEGLILLDENGMQDPVPCEDLAGILSGIGSLRLMVANTCFTAARFAPGMVRAGIPAVIGMRFSLQDPVALRFTLTFYKALLKFDLALDAAMAESRKQLFLYFRKNRNPTGMGHWTYPTLVTSVPGANVFGTSPGS